MVSAWKKLGKFQFELIIITLCDWEVLTIILGLLISFCRTNVQLKFLYYYDINVGMVGTAHLVTQSFR